YGGHEYLGRWYGQKDQEFEPYFSLPRESGASMEIAVGGAGPEVYARLARGGWRLANALETTRDPWTYQDYLRASRAEFCVAKHAYVSTACGWFSDRSAAYLASGRPVVIQDTGFSDSLPCGRGLLTFDTPEQAAISIRALADDYSGHCRAARGIAEECFDARKV